MTNAPAATVRSGIRQGDPDGAQPEPDVTAVTP